MHGRLREINSGQQKVHLKAIRVSISQRICRLGDLMTHRVRVATTQRVCQRSPDPGSCTWRAQGVHISHLVQPEVALDVLGKLDRVTYNHNP